MVEVTQEDREYLILKSGYYYRPNAQGYTNNPAEAGRYTLEEATKLSHPNGPHGPRDGMSVVHISEAPAVASTAAQAERIAELEAEVARLREAHWFYYGDDCSGENCRFNINECISEDFEWDNRPEGDHVVLISGARPVPDMWLALHYYTEQEKDERGDDEPYTYTIHATAEEARQALGDKP